MIHCSCRGIEYFLCSVGLLAECFVVILWRAGTTMTKTTINLWAPLFFLSLFDPNIKDVRNDASFVLWD